MQAGLVLGLGLVVLVGFAVKLSFNLLLWSTDLCSEVGYEEIGRKAGGDRLASLIKVFIILDSLGPLSAYMVLIGDSLVLFIQSTNPDYSGLFLNKIFVIFLSVIFVSIPLSFVEKIERLEWTSFVSLVPLFYLMILQLCTLSTNGVHPDLSMFRSEIFLALPVVVFAYSCQQVMPPIYRELKEAGGGVTEINKVINGGLSLSAFAYLFVGFMGYLEYGNDSQGSILLNMPNTPATHVMWLSMAISVLLSYPVVVFPCRISVDRILFPTRPYTYQRFVLENIAIVFVAFFIGCAIPSFGTLLGIFGAVTATTIGYILPPVFYLNLAPGTIRDTPRKRTAAALLTLGFLAGLVSFVMVCIEYNRALHLESSSTSTPTSSSSTP